MICNSVEEGNCLTLYEKTRLKRTFQRVMDTLILFLLLMLLANRLYSFSSSNNVIPCFLAFLCELWFTISWIFILSTKWTPAVVKTYPDRLIHQVAELPEVDMFVTTADPDLEPPIITVNTILSLLALDYPAHKLACYVSDDGCSPLTFYALMEATEFAKIWVPFCKKYSVQVRAPFRYFSNEATANLEESPQFKQEWLKLKGEYENLGHKIGAAQNSIPYQFVQEFAVFSNAERSNHHTVIKVLWENKGLSDGLPNIIYISREKHPEHPHYYKAGAMNVLTRVSGLMTNAPFMLNVDCDMFVNNPKIALHAMCILLDSKGKKEVAFVQCPQEFYDGIKDDPFGNQLVAEYAYIMTGIAGIQGPYYVGTNCFHRREVIYGLSPDHIKNGNKGLAFIDEKTHKRMQTLLGSYYENCFTYFCTPRLKHTFVTFAEELPEEELEQKFGSSKEFVESAAYALKGKASRPNDIGSYKFLEAASQLANCKYEYGTGWGKQMGWLYGSIVEDVLTGLNMHTKGWRSENCTPEPVAFAGCAPRGCQSTMIQQKRWATGHLEYFFSKHCPILGTLFGKLQFRQCLGYMWICNLGLRPVFEVCYAALPAYCIITNTKFLPKEHGLWIPVALFVIYNIYTLYEYFATGQSIRAWWNNQRMSRIKAMNAWLFAAFSFTHKLLGISDTVFEITQKVPPTSGDHGAVDADASRFTFNDSPVFVPGTTILLTQLTALVVKLLGLQPLAESGNGCGLGEVFCSVYLVVCYWPFLKGLFGKGKYGIPLSTVYRSAVLALLFVHFCRT